MARRRRSQGGPRRVLVTGASGAIGRAIALALARDGFDVAVHYYRHKESAEEVVAEVHALGRQASLLCFDVADREACSAGLATDLGAHGACYGAVCNAGVHADGAFPALRDDEWDRVLRTNLDAFYNVLKPLTMPMVRAHRGGRIVTISSVAGIAGHRGQTNYAASKAGLIGATKSLAKELAVREITVNCVAPGLIETQMVEGSNLEALRSLVPLQRLGRPEEVAAAVSYLFSDGAAYTTGQVLSVNGGLL